ncbi:MAG: protein-glutamate O-methyltransferase CheR [Cyclobacteriaceae bacterium]
MMAKRLYEEISDEELTALTEAIKNRYGIDFTHYEKRSLKRGFSRLMGKNGMDSLLELWNAVLKDQDFFKKCIDDLTVNLTELFRNPEIWDVMGDILENYRTNREINIWHAGCATGEEVYSMAMVAENKKLLHRVKTLGTDISSNALSKAKAGKYPKELLSKYERSLKKYLPGGKITDMFDINDGQAEIKGRFRHNIEFRHHNLVSDRMHKKFEIIFCRNVMIYFDDVLKMQVLKMLMNSLTDDGFLVIGYYDMIPEESREFLGQYDSNNRIYVPTRKLKEAI